MKTNRLKLRILGILLLGTIFACNQYSANSSDIALESVAETPEFKTLERTERPYNQKELPERKLKIIKTATCKLKVDQIEKATALAKKIAFQYEGYVAEERFNHTNYSKENRFTVKVPQDFFDQALDSICGLALFIDHKNISTTDVTEEYIDINARLQTKLEVKERYERILRSNANTVEELLETERQLGKLQEEIDGAKGRLNYLSGKVAYSTIQIDMYETVIPKKEPEPYRVTFWEKSVKALSEGLQLIKNLIIVVFYIWPIILGLLLVLGYFKWYKIRTTSK